MPTSYGCRNSTVKAVPLHGVTPTGSPMHTPYTVKLSFGSWCVSCRKETDLASALKHAG